MLTKLWRRIDRMRTSTKTENIKKYQTEITALKNTITKLKIILEGFKKKMGKEALRIDLGKLEEF